MKQQKRARVSMMVLCVLLSLSFVGCGLQAGARGPGAKPSPGTWVPSEPLVCTFHSEDIVGDDAGRVQLDVTQLENGIVGVRVQSAKRLKMLMVCGEITYQHEMTGDGTPYFFPLQCGNGVYRFRVMENTTDDKYIPLYETEREVTLENEFVPFLRSNSYVNYAQDSACVAKAMQLSAGLTNDADFVAAVYDYIKKNIKYDSAFAQSNPAVYYPDPDTTLSTGKGICFDYAALAAAMLRSRGIPAKLLTGYVSPDNLYHAWNMVYLQDKGWITIGIEASPKDWQRIDITFAAAGSQSYVGDGATYTDRFIY